MFKVLNGEVINPKLNKNSPKGTEKEKIKEKIIKIGKNTPKADKIKKQDRFIKELKFEYDNLISNFQEVYSLNKELALQLKTSKKESSELENYNGVLQKENNGLKEEYSRLHNEFERYKVTYSLLDKPKTPNPGSNEYDFEVRRSHRNHTVSLHHKDVDKIREFIRSGSP